MSFDDINSKLKALKVKGFLADDEAEALYRYALLQSRLGPCLEIGSYCGKSSAILGMACQTNTATLYAVDHHRGSEEHQFGEEYFDEVIFDAREHQVNSFPAFRRTLQAFGLDDTVIPVVTASEILARDWATPLAFVFIDGGHSPAMSKADCLNWAKHIQVGGIIAIHDIFESPDDGGQGPYWAMLAVLEQYDFEPVDRVNSLALLKRVA